MTTDPTPKPTSLIGKLLYVLTPREKRQLALLVPAVMVMATLDVAGIASIVPFLGLLSDPDAIKDSRLLSWGYEAGGFTTRESFFFAVGLGVLAVTTLGNAFSALTTWALLRFSWMRNHSLSMRLLESYLDRPYAYFLGQNTSQLSQKVLSEVQQVINGVFVGMMRILSRLVVVVFILAALVALDPVMAVGVGVGFGGVYGAMFLLVRRKLTQLGQQRLEANRQRFRLAAEMFAGIKEVKLAGLEQTFLKRYAEPSYVFSNTIATNNVIGQVPRYALETIAFGGVMVVVLVLLQTGRALSEALPVIGVYAFAAYRILPSLQQIFTGMSGLRTNAVAFESLLSDLPGRAEESKARPKVEPLPFNREVALEQARFRYEGVDVDALKGLSLSVSTGEWVALVGPTGSGKSTLVDVLLGLLRPTAGAIRVDDVELTGENLTAWQANAAYVPQQIFLADDTIAQNIAFGMGDGALDQAQLEHAARVAQIHDFIVEELPQGYDTVVGERGVRLSGGQRQRLGIARAVYRSPRFLVLDEATSALDNDTEARFFEALRASLDGVSVVSIAHRLSTTRGFDQIYVVERGELVDTGTYDELSARSPHFKVVDEPANLEEHRRATA